MRLSTNKAVVSRRSSVVSYHIGRRLFLLAACSLFFTACLAGIAQGAAKPKVYIKKLKNSHYQLIVERKPYIIKGVCYNPVPIAGNHEYDWWQDQNKPWIVDGKLMQEMGINTVRFYNPGENPQSVKQVISDLYQLYGIRTIMGHWIGLWEYPCPLYGDKDFQERIKKEILDMVNLYKDEPGILLWILGNENNYSFSGQLNPWSSDEIDNEPNPQKQKLMRAEIYYSFVNDIARQIHKIDPNHPVALGNGELISLDVANRVCPDIDLVACIIYRGKTFGNLFKSLRYTFDKPLYVSEFGADSWDAYKNLEDQDMQAFFLESQWKQIYENLANGSIPLTISAERSRSANGSIPLTISAERSRSANNKEGTGNCIGGTMFEWTDEWWKHREHDPESWKVHDTGANWSSGSYYFDIKAEDNKNMNEEWFGIVALSEEQEFGINKRIPRKAYYAIRDFWKNPPKK